MHTEVIHADAATVQADLLVLFMHVQFGLGGKVLQTLQEHRLLSGEDAKRIPLLWSEDQAVLVPGGDVVACANILFVGARGVSRHRYKDVREGVSRALENAARLTPECAHLAITIPGSGIGLDEGEVFKSALGGLTDALTRRVFPAPLSRITIVENSLRRAEKFRDLLALHGSGLLSPAPRVVIEYPAGYRPPAGAIPSIAMPNSPAPRPVPAPLSRPATPTPVVDSNQKPHVFVAMPFTADLDDLYFYGIQRPVNSAGLLCERADHAHFTGDILAYIKDRIGTAAVVIAEMSTPNANVYLEVGYAWGQGRTTLMLTRDSTALKFDVRGQRCMVYSSIRQLEDLLARELEAIRSRVGSW